MAWRSSIENTVKLICRERTIRVKVKLLHKGLSFLQREENVHPLNSFAELSQGLKTMNIYLTQEERNALMQKLDLDRNGEISD